MENFLLIFVCLGWGMFLRRLDVFPENTPQALNLYVIWVALPAMILRQVPTLNFSTDLFLLPLTAWLMAGLGVALVLLGSRLFHWSNEVTAVLLLTVPLGNTSFLGIPMIEAFFGMELVSYGIIYDQFGSFLILSTYGTLIIALYGGGERQTARMVVKKIVTFPPFLSLLVAIFLATPLQQPVVAECLTMIASSLVPVVMFGIGLQLRFRLAPGHTLPFCYGLTAKLLVAPFIALLLWSLVGLDSPSIRIAIFEAGMPPMVVAGAMAMSAGLAPQLTAALVGWGILASFATLSLLVIFL